MTKEQKQRIGRQKVRLIQPILDKWNSIQQSDWIVEQDSTVHHVKVHSKQEENSLHGILLSQIGGVCNAYGWTWAVYRDEFGVYMDI